MTDPTITIAGLRAQVDSLETSLRATIDDGATSEEVRLIREAERAAVAAERDALAVQLAEVRAELAKAPKVCAIHSYEHGPGPCMTCGAWPPGTRELIAACRTRIAGLEQAADERIKEDKYRGARMDAIRAALGAHPFASDDHIADRIRALTDRVAELEARPVLTVEAAVAAAREADWSSAERHDAETVVTAVLGALGPVTLPSPDRAEGVARRMADTLHEMGAGSDSRPWASLDADTRSDRIVALEYALREELAALAKLSPAPAREAAPRIHDDQLDRWEEVAREATDATWLHGTTKEAGDAARQYMLDCFNRGDVAGRIALVHFPAPGQPEGESMVVAITGNGPTSMANARHIAYASPHNVRLIIDELRRARAELAAARAVPADVASPPRPRCSCTHEAGDSRCNVHPTCSECGASTTRPVDGCEACRGPLPKGG